MLLTKEQHELALKNSEFILLKLAEAKPGDNIVMLGDTKSYELSYLFWETRHEHLHHRRRHLRRR